MSESGFRAPRLRAIARGEMAVGQFPLFLLGFCVAYFGAAKLGIATSLPPEGIVILWPPNAIVLGALILTRRRDWWLVLIATVMTEVAADVPAYPLWQAIGYGFVNFSEAALAAALLSRWREAPPVLRELHDFIRFLAIGPVLASGTAALMGALIYKLGAPEIDYLHYWRVFWLGDALGLLTIGTALLAWRRSAAPFANAGSLAVAEAIVLALGLLTVSVWALLAEAEAPRVYLVFPFLVWAALRFGVRGSAVAVLAVATIAIGSAVAGRGPFSGLGQIDAVVALQGLIAVVAISTFMLAFATEASQRARAELQSALEGQRESEGRLRSAYRDLNEIKRKLDRTVAERTEHLREALRHNEMLLREVHHRVKNNLQLVSALLSLHARGVSDPGLRKRLDEVQGNISAIAATYDMLQHNEAAEEVDFAPLLDELADRVRRANAGLVTVATETAGAAPVSADAAVALSLAINELTTNSIKHAPEGRAVAITAECRRDGEDVLIRIADDGPGFPPGFELEAAGGFGLRMVCGVVAQIGGRIQTVPSERGAVAEIRVPLAREVRG